MEGILRNPERIWDADDPQKPLFVGHYTPEPNSAGCLLDDHEHYSSSPSNDPSDEDYNMVDRVSQSMSDGSSQFTEAGTGSKSSSATASFSAADSSKPTSQGATMHAVEDEILKYRTISSKNPTDNRVPIILVHGSFHDPQVRTLSHSSFPMRASLTAGQIWIEKPDGGQGWALKLSELEHDVHLVDINLTPSGYHDLHGSGISKYAVQNEITCTSTRPRTDNCAWTICKLHDKWPGVGNPYPKPFN